MEEWSSLAHVFAVESSRDEKKRDVDPVERSSMEMLLYSLTPSSLSSSSRIDEILHSMRENDAKRTIDYITRRRSLSLSSSTFVERTDTCPWTT